MPDQPESNDIAPSHGGTPLGSIEALNRSVRYRLAELGIFEVEQLRGLASTPSTASELSRIFTEAGADLDKTLASLPGIEDASTERTAVWSLGALELTDAIVAETQAQRNQAAPVPYLLSLPSSINFTHEMPPIRNQGDRGTCVAFALTGVHEYYRIRAGRSYDLSEQFLYFETKKIDGSGECGTWIVKGAEVLRNIGDIEETIWNYNPKLPCNNNGVEPGDAVQRAAPLKISCFMIDPNDTYGIKAILASGACVAIAFRVYTSWYRSPDTARTGAITMPLGNDPDEGGHAVCLVGYQDDPRWPGGGYFIVRNSWGNSFGWANANGVGYGTIPYAYPRREAATVPPPPPAPSGRAMPLYRYWNADYSDHFYATNWAEIGRGASGWGLEGVQCYVLPQQSPGTVPLHRYWNSGCGDHFYTTNWNELGNGNHGWGYEGVEGFVSPGPAPGTVPLYRYWNGSCGDHFYTTNWGELANGANGWEYEGIQCYVFVTPNPPTGVESEAEYIPPPTGKSLSGEVPWSFSLTTISTAKSKKIRLALAPMYSFGGMTLVSKNDLEAQSTLR